MGWDRVGSSRHRSLPHLPSRARLQSLRGGIALLIYEWNSKYAALFEYNPRRKCQQIAPHYTWRASAFMRTLPCTSLSLAWLRCCKDAGLHPAYARTEEPTSRTWEHVPPLSTACHCSEQTRGPGILLVRSPIHVCQNVCEEIMIATVVFATCLYT